LLARAAAGRVRECHGDLRAEHVVLEGERITIYDCIEFDERLRFIDVASELAFLYMDIGRLGAEHLAAALERAYVERSGDTQLRELLPYFACYRAMVRAKVACIRLGQLPAGDPQGERLLAQAQSLVSLCERQVWRARLPLVLVLCGVGASGKSTLAREAAARSGLPWLQSDAIRKQLAGVAVGRHAPQRAYDDAFTERTYAELATKASQAAGSAGGVIVDATFARRRWREALAEPLRAAGARVVFCECNASEAVLRERAGAREHAPEHGSDATWEIVRSQLERFEPLDEQSNGDRIVVDSGGRAGDAYDQLDRLLGRLLDDSRLAG
jgi:predicted kinase